MPVTLGIDYGTKRIGLAISDADGRMANPVCQVQGSGQTDQDIRKIGEVMAEYGAEAVVIGLPLNMDGSESEQARVTRRFGDRLAVLLDVAVEYWDERLSSHAADLLLAQHEGLTRQKRKARRDAVAAQVILQCFLDYQRNQDTQS